MGSRPERGAPMYLYLVAAAFGLFVTALACLSIDDAIRFRRR